MIAAGVTVESGDPRVVAMAVALLREAGIEISERAAVICLLAAGPVEQRLARIASALEERPERLVVAALPGDAAGGGLRRALRAGAQGIVLDDELADTLVPTVRAVLAGQLVMPPALRRHLAPDALSHREKQVIGLAAAGRTNRQIAGELYLSESTVKTHLSSAFSKLGARSRAEAAALILDPENGYGPSILGLAEAEGRAAA